jgi:hypothetical protein
MTAATMTAAPDIKPRSMGTLERILRGAALTGWFALLLGALLGLLEARPELVSDRMKLPVSLLVISMVGMALIGLLVSLFARAMLRDTGMMLPKLFWVWYSIFRFARHLRLYAIMSKRHRS